VFQLARPPFSDLQLRENLVDTWEAYALGTLIFVVVFAVCSVVSLVCAWYSRASTRRVLAAAPLAFVGAVVLEVLVANDLASRAERATGTSLSWFGV
jgi:hypothetical protein